MKKKKMPVKVLSEKQCYKGFNDLREYDIQAPSLRHEGEYAVPINREVFHCQDSVAVLIYSVEADSFLFCEQFRTGAYFNADDDDCFMLEIPAGMVDDGYTVEEIAVKEVREETGLSVTDLDYIGPAYMSVGRMTEKTHHYYAEIQETPKAGVFGNAHEGEEIRTHLLPRQEVYKMMDDHKLIHAQSLLALNWFRIHKDAGGKS